MNIFRFVLALGVATAAATLTRAEPVPAVNAPAWTLKDLDGKDVSSEQFKGKVVVLDFWATWCVPCREEIPGYIELQKKYGKDGLVIIGAAFDEKVAAVKKFVEKFKVDYPIVMGTEELQKAFGALDDPLPTTFIIDRSGRIRDRKSGAEPKEEFEKKVVGLLK